MKILIIGCGSIGKRHASNAKRFAETAVVDTDVQIAKSCARELKIKYYSDLESGLDWKPTGVIIATPTDLHIPVALKVINHAKHILIEKPISNSIDDAQTLVVNSVEIGCNIYVVCNMRFHPGVKFLHENLKRIGKPLFVRAHYGNHLPNMRPDKDYRKLYCAHRSRGGGVLMDCIHEIDYLMWFFGPIQAHLSHAERLSELEIDVEDYASLCLKHKSGTVSEVHLDYLRPFKRRGCEIVGDHGMLLWCSEGKSPEKCSVRLYLMSQQKWTDLYWDDGFDVNQPYGLLMKEFVNTIKGEESSLLTAEDAIGELQLIENILQKSIR